MKRNLPIWLIIGVGSLVFVNSLWNGFVWDDIGIIQNNPYAYRISNLPKILFQGFHTQEASGGFATFYYKPLPFLIFTLIGSTIGLRPVFLHLLQLSLHLANALLVFLLLAQFFPPTAVLLSALIFLVHPLNVEAAIYSSALQDTLFFFFGLLALHWLRPDKLKTLHYLGAFAALLLSLLSKETGVLFLPLVTAYRYIFGKSQRRQVVWLTATVALVYGSMRLVASQQFSGAYLLGARIMNASLTERLLTGPKIVAFYLTTFFFPKNLAISQHWLVSRITLTDFYLPIVLTGLGVILFFWTGWRIKQSAKPHFRAYFFFGFWFWLGIGLHLQIVPLDMTVADRWFYFPMVGLLGLLATTFLHLKPFAAHGRPLGYLTILAVVVLALLTMRRTFDWRSNFTLASHDIAISTESTDLENILGAELFARGDYDAALVHFQRIVELDPQLWTGWNNMGVVYLKRGDTPKAEAFFRQAVVVTPLSTLPFENLAKVLVKTDPEAAKTVVQAGLKNFPANPNLWLLLADIENRLGKPLYANVAVEQYRRLRQTAGSEGVIFLRQQIPLRLED